MKPLLTAVRQSILATLALTLVCCAFYPLAVWALAQSIFPFQSNGSLVLNPSGQVIASSLIGQSFSQPQYFHPRPSAAGNGYDPANSAGSNLGPTSKKLRDLIQDRITTYRRENQLPENHPVPADAVTASASGLDPHISLTNAMLQAPRIAQSRHWKLEDVHTLIQQYTQPPDLGFLGEPRVHVTLLNLALDQPGKSSGRKIASQPPK